MKATGIVRKIDDQGRIILPIDLRRTLDIEVNDTIEIYVEKDYIILKKNNPSCMLCGSVKDLVNVNGKYICKKCIEIYRIHAL